VRADFACQLGIEFSCQEFLGKLLDFAADDPAVIPFGLRQDAHDEETGEKHHHQQKCNTSPALHGPNATTFFQSVNQLPDFTPLTGIPLIRTVFFGDSIMRTLLTAVLTNKAET